MGSRSRYGSRARSWSTGSRYRSGSYVMKEEQNESQQSQSLTEGKDSDEGQGVGSGHNQIEYQDQDQTIKSNSSGDIVEEKEEMKDASKADTKVERRKSRFGGKVKREKKESQ